MQRKLNEGVDAFNRGDFAAAEPTFRSLAEKGMKEAEYMLGRLYEYGDGMERDEAEAMRWLRKAAAQGMIEAQEELGELYNGKFNVEKNLPEAIR